ncbi:hypothetical protein FACS1894158_17830 [Betaproteobacteria bacterium]|nr:hypothetical protein FACS1894158_17830 [Betaproteobacteria bacterium]
MFWLQLSIILIALCIGARLGGIVMGMVGGMGLAVLVFMFGLAPSSPPVDVMLIITSVVLAASVLQAAGGMDYMVSVAENVVLDKVIAYFKILFAGNLKIRQAARIEAFPTYRTVKRDADKHVAKADKHE